MSEQIDRGPDAPRMPDQLAGILRARIARRAYKLRVPSIVALAGEFGVGRQTAWQALKLIEDAGLVEIDRGRGHYLTEDAVRLASGDDPLAKLAAARRELDPDEDGDGAPVAVG
jgi:DNA-binding transcriptional regulator YhcF (GntR family)